MNGAWRGADIAHREPMLIKWALTSVILATKATRGLRVCLAPHADLVLEVRFLAPIMVQHTNQAVHVWAVGYHAPLKRSAKCTPCESGYWNSGTGSRFCDVACTNRDCGGI